MDPLRLLQRAFDLLRYGNYLAGRSGAVLDRLAADMLAALGPEVPRHRAAVRALVRRWDALGETAFRDVERLTAELDELSRLYRAQAGRDLDRDTAAKAVDAEIVGLPVDRWLDEQRRMLAVRSEAQLRGAMTSGETAEQVAGRVRQTVAQRDRETATLLRTAVTRTATESYARGLQGAGVDRYRYVAVMDARTTREGGWHGVGCWGANDRIFRFDDPEAPRPGWHWNCRSHIEPVTEAEPKGFGAEALERAGFNVPDVQAAEREFLAEGATARPTSSRDWKAFIRSQPVGVRVEVLGPAGSRRIGLGLNLSTVAQRETSQLTLEELRARL